MKKHAGRSGNPMTKKFLLGRLRKQANGCWVWQGTVTHNGYGQVRFNQRRYRPHRVALYLWKNFDLDSELLVCHHCDNRLCCNPKHLFAATQVENMIDCHLKGRLRTAFKPGHKYNKHSLRENILEGKYDGQSN